MRQAPFFGPLRRSLVLAIIALFAVGCITIEENYTFKKDGSGSMEYVVDLSAFADLMKSVEGLSDEKSKDDGMGEMDMKEEAGKLKGIKGISKVKIKEEKDGFVQRLSFRFADVDALNEALNVLLPDSTGARHGFFAWEGNTLVRTNNQHAEEMGSDLEQDGSDTTDMSGFLKSMMYKYSFTFANDIVNTGAAATMTKESPDARSVKFDTDFSAIAQDDKALDLRIELKKP